MTRLSTGGFPLAEHHTGLKWPFGYSVDGFTHHTMFIQRAPSFMHYGVVHQPYSLGTDLYSLPVETRS